VARRRPRCPAVRLRPGESVRRRSAPRRRDRRRCRRAGSRACCRSRFLRRHGSVERQVGHSRDRRRLVGDADAARLDRRRAGCRGRRGRHDRHGRRSRCGAVGRARHPSHRRRPGLRRPAEPPARACVCGRARRASGSVAAGRRSRGGRGRSCRCGADPGRPRHPRGCPGGGRSGGRPGDFACRRAGTGPGSTRLGRFGAARCSRVRPDAGGRAPCRTERARRGAGCGSYAHAAGRARPGIGARSRRPRRAESSQRDPSRTSPGTGAGGGGGRGFGGLGGACGRARRHPSSTRRRSPIGPSGGHRLGAAGRRSHRAGRQRVRPRVASGRVLRRRPVRGGGGGGHAQAPSYHGIRCATT
jgi:hypothetical protein